MNRFYFADQNIIDFFEEKYKTAKNILEIGPGKTPLKFATHLIDIIDWSDKFTSIKIDINEDKIPFPDDFFDFTYCRHVLEDIYNPKFALKEIIRTSKAFYIETPSPQVELSRGIELDTKYNDNGIKYFTPSALRGYYHHRYIISYNHEKNTISFLPKFPFIENEKVLFMPDDLTIENLQHPIMWNTHIFIDKQINNDPIIINYQHGINNFDILKDISSVLNSFLLETRNSTNYFYTNIIKSSEIKIFKYHLSE